MDACSFLRADLVLEELLSERQRGEAVCGRACHGAGPATQNAAWNLGRLKNPAVPSWLRVAVTPYMAVKRYSHPFGGNENARALCGCDTVA